MATRKRSGTPPAPTDRVQMVTRNPDGSARQTDGYEIVGPQDVAERAAAEQLTQLHISNADQAWQRERLAAAGGVGDTTPDDEVQARIDHHESLAEHAASQAKSEVGGSPAETAPPAS